MKLIAIMAIFAVIMKKQSKLPTYWSNATSNKECRLKLQFVVVYLVKGDNSVLAQTLSAFSIKKFRFSQYKQYFSTPAM